jgi:hypothetical protein
LTCACKDKKSKFFKIFIGLTTLFTENCKTNLLVLKALFYSGPCGPNEKYCICSKKIGFHRVNQKVNIRFKNPKFPNSIYHISAIVIPMRESSLKNVLFTENSTI